MKKPTMNPLATLKDCAKPPRPLRPESLRYWRNLTRQLVAEGRLRRTDLEALALCCVALSVLDDAPNLEHLAEAREWLTVCGLTPEGRGPKPYTLRKGEPIGSYRKGSKVPLGGTL